jgi:hypothetical protein
VRGCHWDAARLATRHAPVHDAGVRWHAGSWLPNATRRRMRRCSPESRARRRAHQDVDLTHLAAGPHDLLQSNPCTSARCFHPASKCFDAVLEAVEVPASIDASTLIDNEQLEIPNRRSVLSLARLLSSRSRGCCRSMDTVIGAGLTVPAVRVYASSPCALLAMSR